MAFDEFVRFFRRRHAADLIEFKALFQRFQHILTSNNRALELMSELEDKLSGEYIFDINYLRDAVHRLSQEVSLIIADLNAIAENRYPELFARQTAIQEELHRIVEGQPVALADQYAVNCDEIDCDFPAVVGGKNAMLGEIRNHLDMPTPDGFALTTAAYRRFMEYNRLWPEIRRIHAAQAGDRREFAQRYDRAIDDLFAAARLPPAVERALAKGLQGLHKRHGDLSGLAVRSSASGEDAPGHSFAGQFRSFLNCRSDDVVTAYVRVVASRFSYAAVVYGGGRALDETELPMAVGVQQMITARAAGVLHSADPSGQDIDRLNISAGFGLGTGVVGGTANVDFFAVSRTDPTRILTRRIGTQKTNVVPTEPQGVTTVALPEEQASQPCLSDDRIVELAQIGLLLERHFGRPVDVEWCLDPHDRFFILQCRPLRIPRGSQRMRPGDLHLALAEKPVLMRDRGEVAQRGIAAGRVWQAREDDDPATFPVGAIAVARHATPRLTAIVRRAAAIITDVGSSTGHMATVAREFGLPMIVNAGEATRLLPHGEQVTVDAEENVVYRGTVSELLQYSVEAEDVFRDLKEYQTLRQLLKRIVPLQLTDPDSPNFTAQNCHSYHDIVRFSHQKAVHRLIDLNVSSRRFRGVESRKLKLSVPLGLSVVDLGGGLNPEVAAGTIESVEQVRSIPMRAILKGLTAPGTWSTQPMQLGLGDLVSSLTRYTMTDRAAQYQGQNLAVVSDCYANLSLRLGYHFNVVDTYVSEQTDDNYIYFRFVGGVTETERRHLRARLLQQILVRLDFNVSVTGDLVLARLKKRDEAQMVRVLVDIGRLIGVSRQLDTQMRGEESIAEWFRAFFENRDPDTGGSET